MARQRCFAFLIPILHKNKAQSLGYTLKKYHNLREVTKTMECPYLKLDEKGN